MLKGWSCSSRGVQPQSEAEINSLFFSFEFEFIATAGRLAKVPNGNLGEDDPLIKGPSLQHGHTDASLHHHQLGQTVQCSGQASLQCGNTTLHWSWTTLQCTFQVCMMVTQYVAMQLDRCISYEPTVFCWALSELA